VINQPQFRLLHSIVVVAILKRVCLVVVKRFVLERSLSLRSYFCIEQFERVAFRVMGYQITLATRQFVPLLPKNALMNCPVMIWFHAYSARWC
jgi:hypothetical protein